MLLLVQARPPGRPGRGCLSQRSEMRVLHERGSHSGSKSVPSSVRQTRLLVRQAAVFDVEVGVEERGALRPRKAGWALIHSLGFISRA